MPLSSDDGKRLERRDDRRIAGRTERPDRADARFSVGRVERLGQPGHRFRRERRVQPANGERQILPHARVVVFGSLERLHELRRERPVGPDLRIAHQPRQLVGGRPAPIGSAVADLAEVFLRRAVVGQERTEADIHRHGDTDDGQRNQKKLNSEGGRGAYRVTSRGFALDEFVHEWDASACRLLHESVQVLLRGAFSGQAAQPLPSSSRRPAASVRRTSVTIVRRFAVSRDVEISRFEQARAPRARIEAQAAPAPDSCMNSPSPIVRRRQCLPTRSA